MVNSSFLEPRGNQDPTNTHCQLQAHGCLFWETSAKDSTNPVEMVLHVVR